MMDEKTAIVICCQAYEALLAHLQSVYPEEGCGIIGKQGASYCRHFPIENILHSPVAYEMDPTEQVLALMEADFEDEGGIVIYHSHPGGPAYPSATDLRQVTYPGAAYLIVSLQKKDAPIGRVFGLADGQTTELRLIVQ